VRACVRACVHACVCACVRVCMRACVRASVGQSLYGIWWVGVVIFALASRFLFIPAISAPASAMQNFIVIMLSNLDTTKKNKRVQQEVSVSNSHIHVPFLRCSTISALKRSPQQTHYDRVRTCECGPKFVWNLVGRFRDICVGACGYPLATCTKRTGRRFFPDNLAL